MNKKVLTKQDEKVLDEYTKRHGWLSWNQARESIGFESQDAEELVILSRIETGKKRMPVVSIEWLKEYLAKQERNRSQFPNTAFIWVDDLLEAVNKAVKEKE